jgi:hypothetical protein
MAEWPTGEWSDPNARKYLEALGVMSLRYDTLQNAFTRLIEVYLIGIPEGIVNQLLVPLNNSQRSNLLRQIAIEMEQSEDIRSRLFLHGFSLCAENRNIALHAGGHLGDTHFHFIKRRGKAPFDLSVYSISIDDLRNICDCMSVVEDFAWGIRLYVQSRTDKSFAADYVARNGPISLPDKPALPHKLSPPPLGKSHPDGPIFF